METQRYGRYTLIEQIGQGGMSIVYQARDPVLDRFVALKLLHPHLAERADSRARFAREAKAVARLKHPNIMEVFDYAPAESMRSYIVTEYINGPTLRQFLGDAPLSSPEAAVLLLQPIADALARAHDAGIVHRDVKPENIMIRDDGSPVLMDFGIAQMIDMPTLTATGTILGSPAHMAPEVIDGSEVDTPADVFSFGTVLYWCISGFLPFTGPNPSALFRRILETDFDPLDKRCEAAGWDLVKLVSECMSKEPRQRPTARQVSARMKVHLEKMGFSALDKLRGDLVNEREKCEPFMIKTTIETLLDLALKNIGKEPIPRLLDYVNRALAHDPSDKRAQRTLHRITQRRRTINGVAALSLFCLAALVWSYFSATDQTNLPQSQLTTAAANNNEDLLTMTIKDVGFAANEKSGNKDALVPLDGQDAAATSSDMVLPVAVDAMIPVSVVRPATTTTSSKNSLKTTEPRDLFQNRKTTKNTAKQDRQTKEEEKETKVDGPLTRVQLSSELQGAKILINGELHPEKYLSQIRAKGGLMLPPGKHRIEIENIGCKTTAYDREVIPGQRVPAIFHACKWLDAYLKVDSASGALEIRDKGDKNQRILGETNQRITIDMDGYRARKELMIRTANNRFENIAVELTAGKTTTVRIDE